MFGGGGAGLRGLNFDILTRYGLASYQRGWRFVAVDEIVTAVSENYGCLATVKYEAQ